MIKKIFAALLIICITVLCCVSCKPTAKVDQDGNNDGIKVEEAPEAEHFQMFVKDRFTGSYTDPDTNEVFVDSIIRRASFTAYHRINKPIKDKMNETLNSAYERNVDSYNELSFIYEDFKNSGADDEIAMFPWHIYTDYELIRNDGKVVTVKETVDYFAGSPGGSIISTYFYNFDARTGDLIPQLLYTEGNDAERDAADTLVYNKLVEKYGEDVISYDNVQSSFVESSIESWCFGENGLILYFNAYKIAPGVAGDFEIEISKDELPESALAYFLN